MKLFLDSNKHDYTTEEAVQYIIERCRVMARLNEQDNGIRPPSDDEMTIALEDALNYINSFPPQTSLALLSVINNDDERKYITLICYGTLKFTFEQMLAYIKANLMDVVIDEFAISSRLNEYESLLGTYNQLFEQRLQQDKQTMGSIIKGYARETSQEWICGAPSIQDGPMVRSLKRRYFNDVKNIAVGG